MTVTPTSLYTIIGSMFAVILGCYIYVHRKCAALESRVAGLETDTVRRLGRLETDLVGKVGDLRLDMTERLARLDTKMGFLLAARGLPAGEEV